MKSENEYEKRCKAVQLYHEGMKFNEVLRVVQRGRFWLSKWLRRYEEDGMDGLRDKSRTPRKVWRKTPEPMVRKILAIRAELETHRSRRSAFAGIGAEVIQWELTQRGTKNVPSIATISRILARHGKTNKAKPTNKNSHQPYPYPRAEKPGDLHQTDLVGPRHLRAAHGAIRFYSFHTVDVAGHAVFASQFANKQSISLCRHLVETWKNLGIPEVAQLDNEMAASGGGRYQYSISQVIRLHLLLGIHLVFIPQGEPGRNAAVESFNALWQKRVLQRHRCPTLQALKRTNQRFLDYYHYGKPHRGLTQKEHKTRFPGELRDRLWKSFTHLPKTFSIESYTNAKGSLNLPVSRGKVSFVRKVDSHGRVEVNGFPYFIRRSLEGQYLIATIYTHRRKLVIKQDQKIVKSFHFPIPNKIVAPLLSQNITRTNL